MWFALDVTFEQAAREAVEYALMEAGALGTEELAADGSPQLLRAVAYFDARPVRASVDEALGEALRIYGLPGTSVREVRAHEVTQCDWLAEWKKGWQPVEVGRSFVIAPPWSEVPETPARHTIRIEPGMAFGTGTHETTRLCLAAIEKHFAGASFLDVGTGTGVLAIAAAKLQSEARIEACDTDALCITIAHQNARLNGVAERIDFRVGTIHEATPSVACVCANLTADVILPLLPSLIAATCERLILSGILATQSATVLKRLVELGVNNYEVTTDGEWIAIAAVT